MKSTTLFATAALIVAPALVSSNAAVAATENGLTAVGSMKAPAGHKTVKHPHGKHAQHVHLEKRSAV